MTKSIGAQNHNQSVTMPLKANLILDDIAREYGISKNEFCRQAIAHFAAVKKSARALAFKAALNKQAIYSTVAIIFVGFITIQSWATGDAKEFRRVRGVVRIVRGTKDRVQ